MTTFKHVTRSRRPLLIFALASALLAVPALLWAAGPGFGPGAGGFAAGTGGPLGGEGLMARIVDRLELTPQQVEEIRGIRASHRAELEPAVDAVIAARRDLFDAVHADVYDEGAVVAAADSLASAQLEVALIRGAMAQELRQVLTVEQQEAARTLVEDLRALVDLVLERVRARFAS